MNENRVNTIPANLAENGANMAQATNRAFADERRAAIMEMLEHNASVQVAEIAQTFGVSSVTARADWTHSRSPASCAARMAAPYRSTSV